MSDNSALGHGHLTPSDTFEDRHALLQKLIAFYIDEVGAGTSVLNQTGSLSRSRSDRSSVA